MTETNYETVQWKYDEETKIGRVVLDRPDSLNAISDQMLRDLVAAFDRFEEIDDPSTQGVEVRAVIVEGAGDRAFSTGRDLYEIDDDNYPHIAHLYREVLGRVADYGAPTIAKIDGYCVGGGLELAMACDFLFASERSEFGLPEIDRGFPPAGGGVTQRLTRVVGKSRAKELCMTGEFFGPEEAEADGIVDHVHPAAELADAVQSFAETLASKPPLAIRMVKDAIDKSEEMNLQQGIEYEYQAYLPLMDTKDYTEGVAAFREDREPEWTGR